MIKIDVLIVAAVVAIFGFSLFVIGFALKRQVNRFMANARACRAEVIGYTRGGNSSWYTLLVKLIGAEDDGVYSCKSGKINTWDYPKGTIINVVYSPQKMLGINFPEIHLADNPPHGSIKLGRIIEWFGLALLVISVILVTVGIVI